jgi:site-specific DNA-methyltransferase (adenine-specific)
MKTNHQLIVGNTKKVIKTIRPESIQLIVTSPPYWNVRDYEFEDQIGLNDSYEEYLNRMYWVFDNCVKTLLPGGRIAVVVGNVFSRRDDEKRTYTSDISIKMYNVLDSNDDLLYVGTIYWVKPCMRSGKVLYGSYPYPPTIMIPQATNETIHVFRKKGERKVDKEIKELSKISKEDFHLMNNSMWAISGRSNKIHKAVFPYEIARRLILMYSFYGDIVLDPFAGSGTTNIEALRNNRNSIGIDGNVEYLKSAYNELKSQNLDCNVELTDTEKIMETLK